MVSRAYGVVGGAAVLVLALGVGSSTGIGALGTIDPNGPRFSLPSANPSRVPQAGSTATPEAQPPLGTFHIPDWITTALTVLAVGAVVLLVGWFFWRVVQTVQRGRHLEAARASTAGDVIEEIPMSALSDTVEASLNDLRSGLDTDDAILECWRRLERLGEQAGAPRRDSDTSTEYVSRLLVGVPGASTDLADLARLYRSAMFSGLASDPTSRETAIACLERLSAAWEQETDSGA